MAREFAGNFYKRKQWTDTREYIMSKYDWICQHCQAPAKIVHHIIHLNAQNIHDPMIAYGEENLIPLCADCHAKVHSSNDKSLTDKGLLFDIDGNLIQVDKR